MAIQAMPAGTRIAGRFTLEAPLSAGAMGAVYRARDDADPARPVALKHLLDPRHAARFEIEGRLLAQLQHPRVVGFHGPVFDGDMQFLAMDLVNGHDLLRELEEQGTPGLPVNRVVKWMAQACEGLEYVHEQQIVHRDIKPSNLVLGSQGIVLVDFGIAGEMTGGEGTRQIMGTPYYMAPEVRLGAPSGPRSDIYSLAATAWRLLSGEALPVTARSSGAKPCEDITPEADAALQSALQFDPDKRPASAAAFAESLGRPVDDTLRGAGLALSLTSSSPARQRLLEAIVRTAAGVFEAAATSIALIDRSTGELVYHAAWGAGAQEVVGMRLEHGRGLAGAVVTSGEGIAVPQCRTDPRFAAAVAARSGYVPHTMLLAPLRANGELVGVLTVLDRRDGNPYGVADLPRADLFADLAVVALDV